MGEMFEGAVRGEYWIRGTAADGAPSEVGSLKHQ